MWWLFKFIFTGQVPCQHKWQILEKTILYRSDVSVEESENSLPIGRLYFLQCEKCGAVKKEKLSS